MMNYIKAWRLRVLRKKITLKLLENPNYSPNSFTRKLVNELVANIRNTDCSNIKVNRLRNHDFQ